MRTGIKNLNYLNVKGKASDPWNGSTGLDADGHAIFVSDLYGLRAAVRSLARKWEHGPITLLELIGGRDGVFEGWAPVSDPNASNDPVKYSNTIAGWMSVPPERVSPIVICLIFNRDGNVLNHPMLRDLVRSMAAYECYHGFDPGAALINSAINLYEADFDK